MLVVFLGRNDWANSSNRIARAINRFGGEMTARVITVNAHPFGYQEDIVLDRDGSEEALSIINNADWIISSGDGNYDVFEQLLDKFGVSRNSVGLATRHAGSSYRRNPGRYEHLDRDYWNFERVFVACDLYRFVKDDPRSRVFVQPQDNIAENVTDAKGDIRVCHAPSNRLKKGTEEILEIIRQYDGGIKFNIIENVPYSQCYQRLTTHHILVDQCTPDIGAYGATAMEALSNGLAVISNYRHVIPEVERWVPIPPIVPINEIDELPDGLDMLVQDRELLEQQRERSLFWARQYLSTEFTYEYWWRCLTCDY